MELTVSTLILHDKINLDYLEVLNDAIIIVLLSSTCNRWIEVVDRFSEIRPRQRNDALLDQCYGDLS